MQIGFHCKCRTQYSLKYFSFNAISSIRLSGKSLKLEIKFFFRFAYYSYMINHLKLNYMVNIIWTCMQFGLEHFNTNSFENTSPAKAAICMFLSAKDIQRFEEFYNIVATFQGMHVLPAKHSYVWLPRISKCDYQTDTHTDGQTKWSAMLRRRHKNGTVYCVTCKA